MYKFKFVICYAVIVIVHNLLRELRNKCKSELLTQYEKVE